VFANLDRLRRGKRPLAAHAAGPAAAAAAEAESIRARAASWRPDRTGESPLTGELFGLGGLARFVSVVERLQAEGASEAEAVAAAAEEALQRAAEALMRDEGMAAAQARTHARQVRPVLAELTAGAKPKPAEVGTEAAGLDRRHAVHGAQAAAQAARRPSRARQAAPVAPAAPEDPEREARARAAGFAATVERAVAAGASRFAAIAATATADPDAHAAWVAAQQPTPAAVKRDGAPSSAKWKGKLRSELKRVGLTWGDYAARIASAPPNTPAKAAELKARHDVFELAVGRRAKAQGEGRGRALLGVARSAPLLHAGWLAVVNADHKAAGAARRRR